MDLLTNKTYLKKKKVKKKKKKKKKNKSSLDFSTSLTEYYL